MDNASKITPSEESRMNTGLTPQQKLYFQQEYDKNVRNPNTALVLALLLGGFGAHRFYLRQMGWGIAYVLFSWTFIPVFVALIECFVIRKRTAAYHRETAQLIEQKMGLIFSTPSVAM
jgi:TM2 domain-containing membrane protein YozV